MISAAITIHTVTDRQPDIEVEPVTDTEVWLRVTDGDIRVCFPGTFESLRMFFNSASDVLVAAEAKLDEARIAARAEMLFDEEFGICLDPCEHASVNGTTCAACGAEVAF